MAVETLIINGSILPLAPEADADADSGTCIDPGFVHIRGNRIHRIGPMAVLGKINPHVRVLDGAGHLVMPGLVNTHTHAAMVLFRGLADDLPLMDWLQGHIFPAEARHVNPEMVFCCAKLAAAEMIRSGTTSAADGYFHEESVARAFIEAGLRGVVAQGVIDFPAPGVPDPTDNVAVAEGFVEAWQDRSELITPAIFCHSVYTCSAATLTAAKKAATRQGVDLYLHLAETRDEIDLIRTQHHTTPVRYLDGLGLLDSRTVCDHAVWLDDEEIDILAQRDVRVALCPSSNMKLASGVAPVIAMLDRRITMGMGSDGCASNNTQDLFVEMDLLAKLHKCHALDPTVLPALQVLNLATAGGAATLGRGEDLGRLAPGALADLIMIDLQQPHLTPMYQPASHLVYAAGGRDVATVIINGKLVMHNRQLLTLDEPEIMARVRQLADRVRS